MFSTYKTISKQNDPSSSRDAEGFTTTKTRIMEETFEEYLLKQLEAPVILKDGSVAVDANGNPLTKEQAIATNLINNAIKGDIKSIQYINLLKQQSKRKKK